MQLDILVLSLFVWNAQCLNVYVTNHSSRKPHSIINKDNALFKLLEAEDEPFIDIEESWNAKPCSHDGEVHISPHLTSILFCKKTKKENQYRTVIDRCPKGQIVNAERKQCEPLPGKGFAVCFIPHAQCPDEHGGPVAHPHEEFETSYVVCLKDGGIVVADCQLGHHFDPKTKQCQLDVDKKTVLTHSMCEGVDFMKCAEPGIFALNSTYFRDKIPEKCKNCFYFCNLKNSTTYELTVECPDMSEPSSSEETTPTDTDGTTASDIVSEPNEVPTEPTEPSSFEETTPSFEETTPTDTDGTTASDIVSEPNEVPTEPTEPSSSEETTPTDTDGTTASDIVSEPNEVPTEPTEPSSSEETTPTDTDGTTASNHDDFTGSSTTTASSINATTSAPRPTPTSGDESSDKTDNLTTEGDVSSLTTVSGSFGTELITSTSQPPSDDLKLGDCESFLNLTCPSVGFFRFNGSCTDHYQCVKNKACNKILAVAKFKCPRCLKFNAKKMTCDLPQNVPECTYLDWTRGFHHTKYGQRKYCTGEGTYVVPENCTLYYDCLRGRGNKHTLSLKKCPGNTKFNDETKTCEADYQCPKRHEQCRKGLTSYDKYSCEKFYYCNEKDGDSHVTLYCPEGYVYDGQSCIHKVHTCIDHCLY